MKGPAQVVQALCGIWTIRSYRLQSSCGFQTFPGREQNPREPKDLRVATMLQEKTVGGEKRTEMERGKNTLSGLWVSEHDQCGLET